MCLSVQYFAVLFLLLVPSGTPYVLLISIAVHAIYFDSVLTSLVRRTLQDSHFRYIFRGLNSTRIYLHVCYEHLAQSFPLALSSHMPCHAQILTAK